MNTIDVSTYDVILPVEGFFIAIEFDFDIHFTLNPLESYTLTGPILRPPCARPAPAPTSVPGNTPSAMAGTGPHPPKTAGRSTKAP